MQSNFSHEPEGYTCPFCNFLEGNPDKYNTEEDIIYRNNFTTAFIAPKWWVNNKGHVLVVPNNHYENIYGIPDDQLTEVYKTVKKVATAIRSTYDCDGTSTRQHNEPAGDQDVWHLHAHVYPRYTSDKLYHNHDQAAFVEAELRLPYAQKLRAYFAKNTIVCITTQAIWKAAVQSGEYAHSTITSSLDDVGFIHATTPDQTMDIIQRYRDQEDVLLLFIDPEKVKAPIKFEATSSGRAGLFPHIYGALNTDAVDSTVPVHKDPTGAFTTPKELKALVD